MVKKMMMKIDRYHAGTRIEQRVGAQDRRDRSAAPTVGAVELGSDDHLRANRHQAAE